MSRQEHTAAIKAALASLAVIFTVFYLSVSLFYVNHFSCNMFVNGIRLTGENISGANKLLNDNEDNGYTLVITKDGEEVGRINDRDINSSYDYTESLSRIKSDDTSLLWFPNMAGVRRYDILPNISYDEELAVNAILALDFVSNIPDRPEPVFEIVKNSGGLYELNDNHGELKDKEKLVNHIMDAIKGGRTHLELNGLDYSFNAGYTEEELEQKKIFETVDIYQHSEVELIDKGAVYDITGADIADLLVTDSDGAFVTGTSGKPLLSDEKINDIVLKITESFNSKESVIYWDKYAGGTVSLNAGRYGRTVDEEKTAELIRASIESGTGYNGEPVYTDDTADNEIGDTYVEVDMTRQHLYFIKNGSLVLHSDVVTGNTSRKNGTPQTIEPIYFMQKNRVLVGDNYRTPVKFWMAFHNHVGLHDADWRAKFGGEIYKTNGSHGCVNLPPEFAAKLYEEAYVGLPVITYY